MQKRNIYLDKIPLDEALEKVLDNFDNNYQMSETITEVIPVEEALGRVNAKAVFAQNASPHYYASAMDGVAVDVEVTFGVSDRNSKELIIGEDAFFVDTGDPIPKECNGVIMIEDVNQINASTIEITKAATPWQHVRNIGEDIIASELILSANTQIDPAEIGGLLGAGITEIEVKKQPEVAILPTGSELIEPGSQLKSGKIIEYNSRVIANQIRKWGGKPIRIDKVKDDFNLIREEVKYLSQKYDLVLIIAGSSAGSEDYTSRIIEDLGELLFHGVAIKPGKPLMTGIVDEKIVVGIPGYPVSAYLGSLLFVKPLVNKFLGLPVNQPLTIEAELTQNLVSKLGQEEFIRVKLTEINEVLKAVPLSRGAGVINSVMKSDGFIRVPVLSQGLRKNTNVNVEIKGEVDYKKNLLLTGEKGIVFDLLKDQAKLSQDKLELHLKQLDNSSSLDALKEQSTNLSIFKSICDKEGKNREIITNEIQQIIIINLIKANLGLAFKTNNGERFNSLEDLVQDNILFINRPKETIERELFDNKLQKININDKLIDGYKRTENTGLGVANLIKEEMVDVGIVSQGVANLFGLGFIPLGRANIDLVITEFEFKTDKFQLLLEVIKSTEFKDRLTVIAGYDIEKTGEIIYRK
ncbi:molybdopterin biosynthesis protein [Selenihalanaerobacter shriftii]|uniref:Molybdopterin molybdenumtransferase n=1 Tax=Selenihalanaerobacter shriftii TaxID=142842 RepID=A0A1T4JVG8_9FIRM|nr:molybdopterin biosynthesis protein [Selenihalanaerobacter shriftii]SJZ34143.1 putative molybdopterin biosynthesis protein [Selenihalanaerobacter shriftii]